MEPIQREIITNNFNINFLLLKNDKETQLSLMKMMHAYGSGSVFNVPGLPNIMSFEELMEKTKSCPPKRKQRSQCLETYRAMVIEPKITNKGPSFRYTCLPDRDSIAKHIEKRREPCQFLTLTLEHDELKMTHVLSTLKKTAGLVSAQEIKFDGTTEELYTFLKCKLNEMDYTDYIIMKVERVDPERSPTTTTKMKPVHKQQKRKLADSDELERTMVEETTDLESGCDEEYVPARVGRNSSSTSEHHEINTYTPTPVEKIKITKASRTKDDRSPSPKRRVKSPDTSGRAKSPKIRRTKSPDSRTRAKSPKNYRTKSPDGGVRAKSPRHNRTKSPDNEGRVSKKRAKSPVLPKKTNKVRSTNNEVYEDDPKYAEDTVNDVDMRQVVYVNRSDSGEEETSRVKIVDTTNYREVESDGETPKQTEVNSYLYR